jgi:hypothetical protein
MLRYIRFLFNFSKPETGTLFPGTISDYMTTRGVGRLRWRRCCKCRWRDLRRRAGIRVVSNGSRLRRRCRYRERFRRAGIRVFSTGCRLHRHQTRGGATLEM